MTFERVAPPARRIAAAAVLLLQLPLGCASQSMTQQYHDATFKGALTNVLVVAIRKEEIHRRQVEDAFVAELATRGVPAVPSYREFPDAPPDTQKVIASIRANHYDCVIVSTRLSNTTQSSYIPGHTTMQPVTVQAPFSDAYETHWTEVTVPGYVETSEMRRYQTDVWQIGDSPHMIWSGVMESQESTDPNIIQISVSGTIAPELERAGILPPRRK